MKYFQAHLTVAIVTIALSGCASIPLGLKVAALAGSGVSFVTTGKTLSDHALSSVTSRDCRIMRLIDGRNICASPAARLPPDARQAGYYAVIGSFTNEDNALRWSTRFAEFTPQLIRVERNGRVLYRVAVGPLANNASGMLADQFRLAGIENPWAMTVCETPTPNEKCEVPLARL